MENPVTNITAASIGRLVTRRNSDAPTPRPTTPMANRRHSGLSQCRKP